MLLVTGFQVGFLLGKVRLLWQPFPNKGFFTRFEFPLVRVIVHCLLSILVAHSEAESVLHDPLGTLNHVYPIVCVFVV